MPSPLRRGDEIAAEGKCGIIGSPLSPVVPKGCSSVCVTNCSFKFKALDQSMVEIEWRDRRRNTPHCAVFTFVNEQKTGCQQRNSSYKKATISELI